ncbi:hypothetical protein LLEC1_02196 [Akanthomyces lecanii]|uniref:Amine oxidase n=1 Tax=Cordyceps confragosa TaxID=2714763 RepID=A0A179IIX4_CORDF|nr:hypothetical protein LLEC1_02196 [Akanthomyces lecanii]
MYDVIVVGAGLSGLQAAYSAQKEGLSVIVVEARDRVGGKVWSVPLASKRGRVDLGAAWINDTLQPKVWAYCRRFGLDVVKQRLEGDAIMQDEDGSRIVFPFGITPEVRRPKYYVSLKKIVLMKRLQFSDEQKSNLETIRDHIQDVSLREKEPSIEDDGVSLDAYVAKLGANDKTRKMINLWARVMHGVESTEESAAWFIDYCRTNHGLLAIRADNHTGGQYLRLTGGAQKIADGLASLVGHENIQLSSPVLRITDARSCVTVTTTTGKSILGKRCIISIPSTLYRDLKFSPALPAAVERVTDGTKLGHYNKAIVCYDTPWWRKMGYNGFAMSFEGPVIVARDTSVDENRMYSLTCFVNGAEGEKWAKLHPHQRRAVVLEQLAALYGVSEDAELYRPIEFFDQIWKHEPYSKGALAPITAIGQYTEYQSICGTPVGNLHFVGTEFSRHWKGYMEGALVSGEIGATEVLQSLQSQPVRAVFRAETLKLPTPPSASEPDPCCRSKLVEVTLQKKSSRAMTSNSQSRRRIEQSIRDYEQLFGRQHVLTLHLRLQLASVYMLEGRVQDAEGQLNTVLCGFEETRGKNDKLALEAMYHLGIFYLQNQNLKRAERALRSCWEGRLRTLGVEHPATEAAADKLRVAISCNDISMHD